MTREDAVAELKAAGAEKAAFAEFDGGKQVGLGVTAFGKSNAVRWHQPGRDQTQYAVGVLTQWLKANASHH